jgi:hypothetical protein
MHPSLKDLEAAEKSNELSAIVVTKLESQVQFQLADMDKGYFLKEELAAIEEILEYKITAFSEQYFY